MKSWLFTTDHKRIGILFLFGSMATFTIAGATGMLIRLEKFSIGPTITDDPHTYNVWLYFHGAAMILGYVIPGLTGFFASYFIPLMIGADEVAFPKLNALSLWLYYGAIVMALLTFVIPDPPDIMWTGYPPYSLKTEGNTAFYAFTVLLIGVSAALGAVNFLVTVFFRRAEGMGLGQLNIFVWASVAAFIDQLFFVPVLASSMLLLLADRYLGTSFFDPSRGGDVLLYQNLFWFYSHPAVYVIFLPSVGLLFEIFATMSRNRVFQYKITVLVIWMTMVMAGEVWVHHLFTAGMPNWIRAGMMVTTLMISVPVGLLTISLVGTLYRGSIIYNTAMLYAIASLFMLLIGGLTGIPLGIPSIDVHLSDTTFVHAHFHLVMALFATFAIFGGIYYWFPKMTGRFANEKTGKICFWITVIGALTTFMPLMKIGVDGMPRRYWDYPMFPELEIWHQISTVGSLLFAIGIVITVASWIRGALNGEKAPENPWHSKSLEWTHTASPPVRGNFPQPVKVSADWTPYNYGAD